MQNTQKKFESFVSKDYVQIFPSSRKFYDQEIENLQKEIQGITNKVTDEFGVRTEYELLYNRFIVFAFQFEDKTKMNATYNKLNDCIHTLESSMEITLLDRMNVCFKQGEYVQYKDLKSFKKLIKNKAVSAKTIVFDNLVTTVEEYREYWELPILETWYGRFFK